MALPRLGAAYMAQRSILWLLVVVALLSRLAVVHFTTGFGHAPDTYFEYERVAARWAATGVYGSAVIDGPEGDVPSNTMPPLYSAVVALVYLSFGSGSLVSTVVLQVINILCGVATVALVYLATRQMAGALAAVVAGLIAAGHPVLLGYTHFIWDTTLFILGVTLTVWLVQRLAERRWNHGRMFALGGWLGVLALLNPAATAVYPVFVLWAMRAGRPGALAKATGVAAAILGWVVVLTPWTIRNYAHFGSVDYVRGGLPMEFWLGSCPEADTEPNLIYARHYPGGGDKALKQRLREIGERAFYKECSQRAWGAISGDPARYLRLSSLRAADFWLGTNFTHSKKGGGAISPNTLRAVITFFLICEFVLIVVCLLVVRRPRVEALSLLVAAALFSLVYILTHVQMRYRAPAEPILIMAIGILMEQVVNRYRARLATQHQPIH